MMSVFLSPQIRARIFHPLLWVVLFLCVLSQGVQSAETGQACTALLASQNSSPAKPLSNHENPLFDLAPNLKYKVFSSPIQSFAAKIHAIRGAKKSIDLVVYKLKRDQAGRIMIRELMAALERGVDVRLLIDGAGSVSSDTFMGRDFLESLVEHARQNETPGKLEVKYAMSLIQFNSILWASFKRLVYQGVLFDKRSSLFLQFNQRLHDKGLFIDGKMLFLGGQNVVEENTGLGVSNGVKMWDLDILTESIPSGPAPGEYDVFEDYQKYFEMLMYEAPNRKLTGRVIGLLPNFFYEQDMQELLQVQLEQDSKELAEEVQKLQGRAQREFGFTESHGKFLSQFINLVKNKTAFSGSWYKDKREQREKSIEFTFRQEMQKAQNLIEIMTPYPIFTRKKMKQMKALLKEKKGLEIHIYANSRANSDWPLLQYYFEKVILRQFISANRDPEINGRFKIHSFFAEEEDGTIVMNHSKLVRIDRRTTFGTSSNVDRRSIRMNSDNAILLKDAQENADFSDFIAYIRSHSDEIGLGISQPNKNLSYWKVQLYKVIIAVYEKLGLDHQL